MIYLIRHGQSLSNINENIGKSYDGQTSGVPLTDLGHAQAAALADKIDKEPDLIIHSSLIRTRQTAEPLIQKYPNAEVQEWHVVREVHYLTPETYRRTTVDERIAMMNENFEKRGLDYVMGTHAESFNQTVGRAEEFLKRLAAIPKDKFVVVFSHSGFLKVVNMVHAGKERTPTSAFAVPDIQNTQIIEIEV